ncbi:unnamed protein product [Rhizophagus irregularis]|nr:unnamed protein product [Rhizophagus irregularis]
MWKGGPLQYDKDEIELIRKSNEKVVLRYLHNLRDTREIINKVESYSQANRLSQNAYQDYGLSQNPDTNDYILVFNAREIIYKVKSYLKDKIQGYKFSRITEFTYQSLGQFSHQDSGSRLNQVVLRYLHKSRDDITEGIINKVKSYLKDELFQNRYQDYDLPQNPDQVYGLSQNPDTNDYILVFNAITEEIINKVESYLKDVLSQNPYQVYSLSQNPYQVYGLSQNPDTNDYILVFSNGHLYYYCKKCGNSGNERIDDFIQKKQLKCNRYVGYNGNNTVFEWISYDRLIDVKEIRIGDFAMAIWKDGPLYYSNRKWKRKLNEKVILKYLCSSQNINNEFLNKIMYLMENSYGISQNPNTNNTGWKRKSNTNVALKCLHNSQKFIDEFINEVKAYPKQKIDNILKIYGISQNPNTKDYIMCWDLDPDSRPNSIIIKELITLFYDSLKPYHYAFKKEKQHFEIEKQFKETQENRKVNLLKIKNNQFITHEQAIYTSRLLNPFTKILLKYDDNIDNNTVEITDFTNC